MAGTAVDVRPSCWLCMLAAAPPRLGRQEPDGGVLLTWHQTVHWVLAASGAGNAAIDRRRGAERQVRESAVHGKGVFAKAPIAEETVLGAYPGRVRTPSEVLSKVQRAPGTKDYVFRTCHGWYLDPTDAAGVVSAQPQPGLPWFGVDPTLAFVNEPRVTDSVNVTILDEVGMKEVRFVAACDIAPSQELFIDYGQSYDRSSYS